MKSPSPFMLSPSASTTGAKGMKKLLIAASLAVVAMLYVGYYEVRTETSRPLSS